MRNDLTALKNRLTAEVCDGKTVITIKQAHALGSVPVAVVAFFLASKAATYLYSGGKYHGLSTLPIPEIMNFYGWVLAIIICFIGMIWFVWAYEIITADGEHLIVETRLGLHKSLFSQNYLVREIKNLRLECVRSKSGKSWRIRFDYKKKSRGFETRCSTKEEGHYFLECLKPILAATNG